MRCLSHFNPLTALTLSSSRGKGFVIYALALLQSTLLYTGANRLHQYGSGTRRRQRDHLARCLVKGGHDLICSTFFQQGRPIFCPSAYLT